MSVSGYMLNEIGDVDELELENKVTPEKEIIEKMPLPFWCCRFIFDSFTLQYWSVVQKKTALRLPCSNAGVPEWK